MLARTLLVGYTGASIVAMACITVASLEHVPTSTPHPADRDDCGKILGTSFHSGREQDWFVANCSAWADVTLGEVTAEPATSASPATQAQEPTATSTRETPTPSPSVATPTPAHQSRDERCASLRDRPYERPEDRDWFLRNCPAPSPTPAVASSDLSCEALRGRPYESESQRQWFLANCRGAPPVAQGAVGPAGRDCGAIYGTRYRSTEERRWFEATCPH